MAYGMLILHTSDLHLQGNRHRRLLRLLRETDFDIWVDTGDFAREPRSITVTDHDLRSHQARWWRTKGLARRLADALGARPALMVPGNHDRYVAVEALADVGIRVLSDRRWGVDHPGRVLPRETIGGVVFAGSRAIGWGEGTWPGEMDEDEAATLWRSLDGVDVLLTHGAGVEFGDSEPGTHASLPGLDGALSAHGVRAHLHGHMHASGGRWIQAADRLVVNAATTALLIAWPALTVAEVGF